MCFIQYEALCCWDIDVPRSPPALFLLNSMLSLLPRPVNCESNRKASCLHTTGLCLIPAWCCLVKTVGTFQQDRWEQLMSSLALLLFCTLLLSLLPAFVLCGGLAQHAYSQHWLPLSRAESTSHNRSDMTGAWLKWRVENAEWACVSEFLCQVMGLETGGRGHHEWWVFSSFILDQIRCCSIWFP